MAAGHTPRGFAAALRRAAASGPAIIAELKKASPSKGLIRASFEPASLARSLQAAGAAALSVLTDEPFFQGSLLNLEIASAATSIPCLRKDFIVDEFQIVEARAHHADAILLIAAALTDAELAHFTAVAHDRQLDVLCEVHTADELARGRDLGCDAYGVNNRDLHTFAVTLDTSLRLGPQLPPNAVRVAESGIHTAADLDALRAAGFHAFLIGESLMRQPDPGAALATLLHAAASSPTEPASAARA
jgi:indole-3-glycerol phosphate synthase